MDVTCSVFSENCFQSEPVIIPESVIIPKEAAAPVLDKENPFQLHSSHVCMGIPLSPIG